MHRKPTIILAELNFRESKGMGCIKWGGRRKEKGEVTIYNLKKLGLEKKVDSDIGQCAVC